MKTTILRKRYIPNEVVDISGDQIIYRDEEVLVTQWKAIRPRADLAGGISWTLLKEGVKISKFMGPGEEFLYWYCDIVDIDVDLYQDRILLTDLLMDVKVYPDNRVQVLDADELSDALEQGLIDTAQVCRSLRRLDWLLKLIYSGQFPPAACGKT